MRLLLTNDDGFGAPGLEALAAVLERAHEVWIVAPEREQSAQSHAFTLHKPLRVTERGPRRLTISGTPADCSYAGIHGLVPKPDFVVSGINRGPNLGSDVHYSGTVAAAREAVLQGVSAAATSLYIRSGDRERHWASAANALVGALERIWAHRTDSLRLYNLNAPNLADIRGTRVVPVGHRAYIKSVDERRDPRGNRYIWIGGAGEANDVVPTGDIAAAREGWLTVSPLGVDPTDTPLLETLHDWF